MASNKHKTSLAAEKARKQKIVAIVGGVLLLGIVAIQGPKLWKQLNPPAATGSTAAAPAPAPATAPGVATPVPTAAVAPSATNAVLAGVVIAGDNKALRAQDGKLLSFSLFETKDPFVPQVTERPAAEPASSPSGSPSNADTSGSAAPSQAPTGATPAVQPPKPTYATIEVNGKGQPVTLKGKFPEPGETFVLVGLTHSAAKIAVAGGTFESGKALGLQMGKQVTLVDTATGVRYTLKLVYSSSSPEKTRTFTSAPAQPTQTTTP